MKHILALFLVVGLAFGQVINTQKDGVTRKVFQVYSKASYTSSTANETTAYSYTDGASKFSVKVTATDTVKGVLRFQFKDSFTGYTTAWTAVSDSISLIGSSSTLASDRVHAFASSDTSTSGYDMIRFYIDYVTYLGVAYTGGTVKIYTDIYKP